MNCQRTDWHMRQFCDEIAEAMRRGMGMGEARHRMTERGVPYRVQCRIMDKR